jgi:hypothetical protein
MENGSEKWSSPFVLSTVTFDDRSESREVTQIEKWLVLSPSTGES